MTRWILMTSIWPCCCDRLTEDHQCPGKAAARSFWGGQPTTSGRPGGASAAAPLHNIGTYVAKLTGGAAAAAAPAASSKAPAAKPAAAAPRRGTAAAAVDPANTLRGSAQRRMQQAGSAGTGPEVRALITEQACHGLFELQSTAILCLRL